MFERKAEMHRGRSFFFGLEAAKKYVEKAQKSRTEISCLLRTILNLWIFRGNILTLVPELGNLAMIVAQNNPKVEITALELSADMVTLGEENIRKKGFQNHIKFIKGDAAEKELPTEVGLVRFNIQPLILFIIGRTPEK